MSERSLSLCPNIYFMLWYAPQEAVHTNLKAAKYSGSPKLDTTVNKTKEMCNTILIWKT